MKKLVSLILIMMLLCGTALADTGTVITMDTSNVPVIPEGTLSAEVISFTGNQTYAVYSAPTKKSIRGAKGKARVSTNGWIQVFGAEEDWILVQYDISDKQNRIGYIYINALPKDVTVPDLNLKRAAAVTNYAVEVTDDPLVSKTPLAKLTENTKVTCLGTMGAWTYIEGTEKDALFRGFVPTECLSGTVTTLREAEKAIAGSWKLYAGTSIDASRIVFYEDGSVTGRSTLESGREVEWNGSWQLDYYDSNRSRYWNDSEFELTLSRGTSVELYGLRICRQSSENGKIYSSFCERTKALISEKSRLNVEIETHNEYVSNFSVMLRTVLSILRSEREENPDCDLYVNISSGTSEYAAASAIAAMMVPDTVAFSVGTKEYTVPTDKIKDVYFIDGEPVGLTKLTYDPRILSNYTIEMPEEHLVRGLRILSDRSEKNLSVTSGKMVDALKQANVWYRDATPVKEDRKSTQRQTEAVYYQRDFIAKWLKKGWIAKDELRGRYIVTDDGRDVIQTFYLE